MTLASIGALLVAVTVAASSAIPTEPEHDPSRRAADMAEMGITCEGDTASGYTYFDIPLDDETQEYITDVCDQYGLDVRIMYGIFWQESRFQPEVVGDNGQSFGLGQIKRRWHEDRIARLGVTNLYDAKQNALVACDYMAELLGMYGNYRDALTAYRYGDLVITGEDYAAMVMAQAESFTER